MYSQNDEEKIILEYFGNHVGTLLDIGANDGVTFSNSYEMMCRGWKGVLVEASDLAFSKLRATYNRIDLAIRSKMGHIKLVKVAIGGQNGMMDFYESGSLLNNGDVGLVSSLKMDEVKRWDTLNIPFEKKQVPVITMASLLRNIPFKTIDFCSFDIEGMEPEVVPQVDFNQLGTRLVVIEWNGKNEALYNGHMTAQGFREISRNPENLIFAK